MVVRRTKVAILAISAIIVMVVAVASSEFTAESRTENATLIFPEGTTSVISGSSGGATPVFPNETTTTILSRTVVSSTFYNSAVNTQGYIGIAGEVPLVKISGEEGVFNLTFTATTSVTPVSLAFDLNQSFLTTYTNGTEWISASKVCDTSSSQTSSNIGQPGIGITSVTTITATPTSCNSSPVLGWAVVNGSVADQNVELKSDEVSLSVAPVTIAANQTVRLQLQITLHLKPGVYAIELALGIQTANDDEGFEVFDLSPLPIIVTG